MLDLIQGDCKLEDRYKAAVLYGKAQGPQAVGRASQEAGIRQLPKREVEWQ